MARGMQYICAMAIANGAKPVWSDMHESAQQIVDKASLLLKRALNQARNELQNPNNGV